MVLFRRLLLLWLLLFWLGGFTFYAAVVVPIGADVLGSGFVQGLITRRVTIWLNVAGAAALAAWAWDLAAAPTPTRTRQWLRWLLWSLLTGALVVLIWLHPRLDALLDGDALDHDLFRTLHRVYLWVSTVQWTGAILLTFLMLHGWREADRRG